MIFTFDFDVQQSDSKKFYPQLFFDESHFYAVESTSTNFSTSSKSMIDNETELLFSRFLNSYEMSNSNEYHQSIIDVSTPQTLERDFNYWLYGSTRTGDCKINSTNSIELVDTDRNFNDCVFLSKNCDDDDSNIKFDLRTDYNSRFSKTIDNRNSIGIKQTELIDDELASVNDEQLYCDSSSYSGDNHTTTSSTRILTSNDETTDVTSTTSQTYVKHRPIRRPLSISVRRQILNLYDQRYKVSAIARQFGVTHSCVSKILSRYRQTGSIEPSTFRRKQRQLSPIQGAIYDYVERLNITRPADIRNRLIFDQLCDWNNAPSEASIYYNVRRKLNGSIVTNQRRRKTPVIDDIDTLK